MASKVEICNRALQKLGAKRIVSIDEDSRNARSCNIAYDPVRKALLRSHPWSCAIARASLAADSTAPSWGRANAFQLPANFIRLVDNYPEQRSNSKDWIIEGKKILTNDSAPLNIRYVYDLDDPNIMDALYREAFAAQLAWELCEEITQSTSKKQELSADVRQILAEARRANAIEKMPEEAVEDTWLSVRL